MRVRKSDIFFTNCKLYHCTHLEPCIGDVIDDVIDDAIDDAIDCAIDDAAIELKLDT